MFCFRMVCKTHIRLLTVVHDDNGRIIIICVPIFSKQRSTTEYEIKKNLSYRFKTTQN